MSGKLLLKLEAVHFMLGHHTSTYYNFLEQPVNSRNRCEGRGGGVGCLCVCLCVWGGERDVGMGRGCLYVGLEGVCVWGGEDSSNSWVGDWGGMERGNGYGHILSLVCLTPRPSSALPCVPCCAVPCCASPCPLRFRHGHRPAQHSTARHAAGTVVASAGAGTKPSRGCLVTCWI